MKLINFFINKKILTLLLILLVAIIISFMFLTKSYLACGCGECDGTKTISRFTFFPQKVINKDKNIREGNQCSFMGCGICTKYYYFGF